MVLGLCGGGPDSEDAVKAVVRWSLFTPCGIRVPPSHVRIARRLDYMGGTSNENAT